MHLTTPPRMTTAIGVSSGFGVGPQIPAASSSTTAKKVVKETRVDKVTVGHKLFNFVAE